MADSVKSSGSYDKDTYLEYSDLITNGRDAYVTGHLEDAGYFFGQALEIELELDLDAAKKNSVSSAGSMSDVSLASSQGLKSASPAPVSPPAPVSSPSIDTLASPNSDTGTPHFPRVHRDASSTPGDETRRNHIWKYMASSLEQAETELKVDAKNANAYLRKAAALILMNRWSDAKEVYIEGLRNCKGNQKLNLALSALNKIDSATKRLADVSPITAARTPSPSRSTWPTDSSLSPVAGRKCNRFNMSSWASLDNLDKPKESRTLPRSQGKFAKKKQSKTRLGSVESLLDTSPRKHALLTSAKKSDAFI